MSSNFIVRTTRAWHMDAQHVEKQSYAVLGALAAAGIGYGLYAGGKRLIAGGDMIASGRTGAGLKEMAAGAGEAAISAVPFGAYARGAAMGAKAVGAGRAAVAAGKLPGSVKTVATLGAQTGATSLIPQEAGAAAGAGQPMGMQAAWEAQQPANRPGWATQMMYTGGE